MNPLQLGEAYTAIVSASATDAPGNCVLTFSNSFLDDYNALRLISRKYDYAVRYDSAVKDADRHPCDFRGNGRQGL